MQLIVEVWKLLMLCRGKIRVEAKEREDFGPKGWEGTRVRAWHSFKMMTEFDYEWEISCALNLKPDP